MADKKEIRIIFTGAPGCGKTTAVHTLDIPSYQDAAHIEKRTTTIGQDYGELQLNGEIVLRCYGTPGQSRFAFIWELLASEADGLVIMVDSTRQTPLIDMQIYLDNFHELISRTAAVICVVKSGGPNIPQISDYQAHLKQTGFNIPVIFADSRKHADMLMVLDNLLKQLVARE